MKQYTTEEIQRLLDGVTQGEWELIGREVYSDRGWVLFDCEYDVDAAFIAAAPAIVRQLLEDNKRLRDYNELADEEIRMVAEHYGICDLIPNMKKVVSENAELKAEIERLKIQDGAKVAVIYNLRNEVKWLRKWISGLTKRLLMIHEDFELQRENNE